MSSKEGHVQVYYYGVNKTNAPENNRSIFHFFKQCFHTKSGNFFQLLPALMRIRFEKWPFETWLNLRLLWSNTRWVVLSLLRFFLGQYLGWALYNWGNYESWQRHCNCCIITSLRLSSVRSSLLRYYEVYYDVLSKLR